MITCTRTSFNGGFSLFQNDGSSCTEFTNQTESDAQNAQERAKNDENLTYSLGTCPFLNDQNRYIVAGCQFSEINKTIWYYQVRSYSLGESDIEDICLNLEGNFVNKGYNF